MIFSILVSRHRSNFLRDIALLARFSLLLGLPFSPAVGYVLDCLMLAVLFCVLTRLCHFVQLSEVLVDLKFFASVLLFGSLALPLSLTSLSPLALLAVVVSLFSVFWRRLLLQRYFVVVYCSEVRLTHLQRHFVIIGSR